VLLLPRRTAPHASWASLASSDDEQDEADVNAECPVCRGDAMIMDGERAPNMPLRMLAREWARRECMHCGEKGVSWDIGPQPCMEVFFQLEAEFSSLTLNIAQARERHMRLEQARVMTVMTGHINETLEFMHIPMTQRNRARQFCKGYVQRIFQEAGEQRSAFAERMQAKLEAATGVRIERLVRCFMRRNGISILKCN
jgi:hypothetical protein